MTTTTKRVTKIHPGALKKVLHEEYIWGFVQVSDLIKAVERRQKQMKEDGEI